MRENDTQPIVLKAYDLIKKAIPVLSTFPKNLKFSLADRIQTHLLDLLEQILDATYAARTEKRAILAKVNLSLEKLRFLFRLCFDLGALSHGLYKDFSERIDEIGKMTGGWIKSLP